MDDSRTPGRSEPEAPPLVIQEDRWPPPALRLFKLLSATPPASVQPGGNLLPIGSADHTSEDTTSFGHLSVGLIAQPPESILNEFLIWAPRGIPNHQRVALFSSRLGTQLEKHADVFKAIRTLVSRLSLQQVLASVERTALDKFVSRAADWWDKPVIRMQRLPGSFNRGFLISQGIAGPSRYYPVYLVRLKQTEPGDAPSGTRTSPTQPRGSPGHSRLPGDEILAQWVDLAYVLHCGAGGHTERAIGKRLSICDAAKQPTLISSRIDPLVARPWLDRGGIAWHLLDEAETSPPAANASSQAKHLDPTVPAATGQSTTLDLESDPYLIHCVSDRKRTGWPDETEDRYLDRWLFGDLELKLHAATGQASPANPYSALMGLQRILASGKLVASGKWMHSRQPCVCFTAIPLSELSRLTRFRPHKSNWEFLPFGLCLRRSILHELGCRPVIYGQPRTRDNLPRSQRWRFQPAHSQDGQIDWKREREWRIQGSVDLRQFGPADLVVFVEHPNEIPHIEPLSHWPTVALQQRFPTARIK